MPLCWLVLIVAVAAPPAARVRAADRAALTCFPIAETRQLISDRRLVDPFTMMQAVSLAAHAEPIGAKLCRDREALVYQIGLLRRDGRVMKIYIDALTGQPYPVQKGR